MFHRSKLGLFGEGLRADMQGYVPETGDGPWDFEVDHGSERTHDADGELTEYGQWWEEEGYPEWQAAAIAATERALAALAQRQEQNV